MPVVIAQPEEADRNESIKLDTVGDHGWHGLGETRPSKLVLDWLVTPEAQTALEELIAAEKAYLKAKHTLQTSNERFVESLHN
ncbi:MAG: hypothetical protein WBV39_10490 [Rudaea sp.]